MDEKFLKPYDSKAVEETLYKRWEDSGFFNPDTCIKGGVTKADAETFSIVLPPPNVTGTLHMGHAAMLAIQDVIVRFNRMRGKRTLWLPGTDHAAIATQSKVEKELVKKEGKNRHDLGREEFLKRVADFAQESHDTIVNQTRKMGSSVDWSREAFTLDEKRSHAVRVAFKNMYDAGLIYRGNRIVNWDPKGQTTVSDDEVEHEERKTKLYTFRYSKDFPIPIATTRPETKLGDTAVAVNPEDPRYKEYIGKTYTVPFMGVELSIQIVGDEAVEIEFGTGAVGVTPAHSHTDWEIAERHSLPHIQVINEYGKMMVGDGITDMKVAEAREKIVEYLRAQGLIEKEEEITHSVSIAERSGGIIEPLPKLQWFIDVNKPVASRGGKTLKELMREPVESGKITILPDQFGKTYFHWIQNLRDWCISRQIWYGHRVPVWYCKASKGGKTVPECLDPKLGPIASVNPVTSCPRCGGQVEQDHDTLDTWFSSGLWTFSTLGWPEQTTDLQTYHPTTLLETGYDILFFWVARMILMSQFHLGDIPFKTVYLHGLVRDAQGRKMSKSLGNIIDPLDMIEKYGADATRLSLLIGNAPGNDLRLSEDRVRGYKHFANKLWNIARFILENGGGTEKVELTPEDAKLVAETQEIAKDITSEIENFHLYLGADKLYHYAWHRLADEILEESKSILRGTDVHAKTSRASALYEILITILKLLHPFMPFVTEEIWGSLPESRGKLLMIEAWPL